jgi:3'(2'), 5'-bisphosphate nucleotidase
MNFKRVHLEKLCACAEAAGHEVMDVYRTQFTAWRKDDASPVTEADQRADQVIRGRLQAAFPGVFILSEESPVNGSGTQDLLFIVDPLDGTKEFIQRNDEFTVNIALVDRGVAVAGVVLAPALDQLYFGGRGFGAWKKDGSGATALRTMAPSPGAALRVIVSRSHGSESLRHWAEQLPGEHVTVAAGSSLKFCRIAEGAADLYPRLGPTSQWDTAAAQAVLEEAGGHVVDAAGQPLRYGLNRPILNPNFIALASSRIAYPQLP